MKHRIIVVSAPRSGTHMLCRMISRAAKISWNVPLHFKQIPLIKENDWVVGVHHVWDEIVYPDTIKIGLKRCEKDRKNSISMDRKIFGSEDCMQNIINSLPEKLTVNYELLIQNNKEEMIKLEKIIGIPGVLPEPYSERYNGPYSWCLKT